MCMLVAFNDKEIINGQEWWAGYKVFEKEVGSSKPLNDRLGFIPLNEIHIAKIGSGRPEGISARWNELEVQGDNTKPFVGIGSPHYPFGFHCYLNKQDAHKYHDYGHSYRICRVLFKDILSIGFNGNNWYKPINTATNGLCIISKYLYIKKEDWEIAQPIERYIKEKIDKSFGS